MVLSLITITSYYCIFVWLSFKCICLQDSGVPVADAERVAWEGDGGFEGGASAFKGGAWPAAADVVTEFGASAWCSNTSQSAARDQPPHATKHGAHTHSLTNTHSNIVN